MCGCCSLRRRLDLGEEALAAERGAELRVEHLDGDVAIVLEVVGEIDGRHATRAELPLDAVASGKGGEETVDQVVHREPFRRSTSRTLSSPAGGIIVQRSRERMRLASTKRAHHLAGSLVSSRW